MALYSKYDYIRGSVGVLWFSASQYRGFATRFPLYPPQTAFGVNHNSRGSATPPGIRRIQPPLYTDAAASLARDAAAIYIVIKKCRLFLFGLEAAVEDVDDVCCDIEGRIEVNAGFAEQDCIVAACGVVSAHCVGDRV